jgi:Kef-type K+ transport system membrane component KefB
VEQSWGIAAVWMGLALLASFLAIRFNLSVALVKSNEWIAFLAGFGSILPTFMAGCFITDLGTVVALGVCFARYDGSLLVFVVVALLVMWLAPRFVRWFFTRWGTHVSEPGVKMVFFVPFALGARATLSRSEAVLPAYLVGLALAGVFAHQRDRVRLPDPPFYFLNAGIKVYLPAGWAGVGLIVMLLLVKIAARFAGAWPLTRLFRFGVHEGNYMSLLMSTGLTFGTISALFGLNHDYIDRDQYTILVTVVIGSAVVPTLIA